MDPLLKSVLLRRKKAEMVTFITDHPAYFDKALTIALQNEQPFSWRAAWMICGTMKKNDPRVKPHIQELIATIPGLEDGHQRELLKILLKMDLTEDFESLLFDLSVSLWEQVRKTSSIRCFAFKGMIKVAKKYPELNNEIISLCQPHLINPLSPGIRKGVYKSINELTSQNSS